MAALATGEKKISTMSNQTKLPRLPVPDLDKSMEGYLKSLIPVLEQKVGTFPDQYEALILMGSMVPTISRKR